MPLTVLFQVYLQRLTSCQSFGGESYNEMELLTLNEFLHLQVLLSPYGKCCGVRA
ncbi:MAG: hypothetical protein H6Q17_60 [Bacteroidetes bacterium]|nr:hypothetical protein [Bacteroidota bacterium]